MFGVHIVNGREANSFILMINIRCEIFILQTLNIELLVVCDVCKFLVFTVNVRTKLLHDWLFALVDDFVRVFAREKVVVVIYI